jgi:thiol-disulfide isomerase/thioredoxin
MQFRMPICFLVVAGIGFAESPSAAAKLWEELNAKRSQIPSVHQEFQIISAQNRPSGERRSVRTSVLDISGNQWRETEESGSSEMVRIFDGTQIYSMEKDGDEFVRIKVDKKNPESTKPNAFKIPPADWSKATEIRRESCRLPTRPSPIEASCILFEVPLKPRVIDSTARGVARVVSGTFRMMLEHQTGLLVAIGKSELIERTNLASFILRTTHILQNMSYATPDAELFSAPTGVREVKAISMWNADRMQKRMGGKQAPDLKLRDINGNLVDLAALKGKNVLLDFWTTWCPPCRADAPALDNLHKKFGDKELAIIGISVSEERDVVEKFLSKHPHSFPVVLTSENEMPRPFQIGVFPTYVVIDKDGVLTSVVEGDQGFGQLRKLLKKAGMDVN